MEGSEQMQGWEKKEKGCYSKNLRREGTPSLKKTNPLSYIGGKFYIADWIISHFDYRESNAYIELFGGAGHVLFRKPPHEIEIFNDIDEEVVNFFSELKKDAQGMQEKLSLIPYSRKKHAEYIEMDPSCLSSQDRAIRWFYLLKTSFSGQIGGSWKRGFTKNIARFHFNAIKKLKYVEQRIQNVQIDCSDYRQVLESIIKKNLTNILIYADPPYFGKNYYGTKWEEKDHEELAQWLNRTPCKVCLSYYFYDKIEQWYPKNKWRYFTKEVNVIAPYVPMAPKRQTQVEYLLLNYDPIKINKQLKIFRIKNNNKNGKKNQKNSKKMKKKLDKLK